MRNEKGKKLTDILFFLLPVILILWYWKNTLLHLGSYLYSNLDIPFVIWILQNNTRHLANFDFGLLYETNAMYPFPLSLSFTEHMFFPSFINWMISWFVRSPIAQFNLLAVLNHIMVYVSFYLLAGRFTKNNHIRILSSFFVSFSPYVMGQTGHFQMIFFWPFLLAFYHLLAPKRNLLHAGLAGLFMGLQFLSAVYLGMMGFVIIFAYFIAQLSRNNLTDQIKRFAVFILVFAAASWISVDGYLQMQQMYKPVYDQGQYVTFAAHLSDYFLNFPNTSAINNIILRPLIGKFNRHTIGELAGFVGILPLLLLAILFLKTKSKTTRIPDHGRIYIWLALLVVVGVVSSLGPRANWNGKYLVFPLPYWFVVKFVPFISVIRAVARWYFLIVFALSVFMIFGMEKVHAWLKDRKMTKLFFPLFFVFIFLEFYPAPLYATPYNWQTSSYNALKSICGKDPGPLLEYPFDRYDRSKDIAADLAYKSNNLFVSTQHDCEILSGFSAYEPKKYQEYRSFFQDGDFDISQLILLNKLGIKYVRFNLGALDKQKQDMIKKIASTDYISKLYADSDTIIVRVRNIRIVKVKGPDGKEVKQFKATD